MRGEYASPMRLLHKFLSRMEECKMAAEGALNEGRKEQFLALSRMWERLAIARAAEVGQRNLAA
jgi:hypothetical protein